MTESPPDAVLAVENNTEIEPLFSISVFKLAVMSFFTFGLYQLYWFFKHWQALRWRENLDINPTARTIFVFIFCYSLFSRIQKIAGPTGARSYPGWSTAGYIIGSLYFNHLPDPYFLVSLFTFAFLIPAQIAANRANESQNLNFDRNAHFTKANMAWIAVGALLLGFGIWATFLPDPPEGMDVLAPTEAAAA